MSKLVIMFFAVLALLACVAQAFRLQDPSAPAKKGGLGKCNAANIHTMPDFELKKYQGMWYEHLKMPIITEAFMKCCQTNVTFDDATGRCNMTDRGFRFGSYQSGGVENVTQPDMTAPGKLSTKFYGPFSPVGNYWILDTDYTNYAVVYSCVDLKIFSAEFAWILLRQQGAPDGALIQKAKQVITANGLDIDKLKPTDQINCPAIHPHH